MGSKNVREDEVSDRPTLHSLQIRPRRAFAHVTQQNKLGKTKHMMQARDL